MTYRLETNRLETIRPETNSLSGFCRLAAVCIAVWALAGCADGGPRLAKGEKGSVTATAPRLTKLNFEEQPIADASDFAPWAALASQTQQDSALLDACIADKDACASVDLVRFRRMLELAQNLPSREQLNLVHHYFNTVEWTHDARDTWSTLYHTAYGKTGDCEDIAIAKYQALRRLGWSPENLRVVVGWDSDEHDWHALLAVRVEGSVIVLDSIKGLQSPSRLSNVRLVYSISEQGVWDHAPDFVPVGKDTESRMVSGRAARIAATEGPHHKGVYR